MPFHNVQRYISSAIKAVLAQTFADFELILVDDGSTDRSARIARKFADADPRIVLLSNTANLGIAQSCNRALGIAAGEYIARCDADDLALPDRLQCQLDAATAEPSVGVWGSAAYQLGPRQQRLFLRKTDPAKVGVSLLFEMPIINTTFFAARKAIEKVRPFYDASLKFEDYDLLVRLAGHTRMANLPQPLMKIRVNPNSYTSGLTGMDYLRQHVMTQEKLLRRLGLQPTAEDMILHGKIVRYLARIQREWNFHDLAPAMPSGRDVRHWFDAIVAANAKSRLLDGPVLARRLRTVSLYFTDISPQRQEPLLARSGRWVERQFRAMWK